MTLQTYVITINSLESELGKALEQLKESELYNPKAMDFWAKHIKDINKSIREIQAIRGANRLD